MPVSHLSLSNSSVTSHKNVLSSVRTDLIVICMPNNCSRGNQRRTNMDRKTLDLWAQGIKCLQQVQEALVAKNGADGARLWIIVQAGTYLTAYYTNHERPSGRNDSKDTPNCAAGKSRTAVVKVAEKFDGNQQKPTKQNGGSKCAITRDIRHASLEDCAELSKGYEMLDMCLGTLGRSRGLSGREVASILPEVRRNLSMGSYNSCWHEEAKKKFFNFGHSLLPLPPKAKGFKHQVSLDLLALCCLVSEEWRKAVQKSAGSIIAQKERRAILSGRKLVGKRKRSRGPTSGKVISVENDQIRGNRGKYYLSTVESKLKIPENVSKPTKNICRPPCSTQAKLCLYDVPSEGSCLFHAIILGVNNLKLPIAQGLTHSLLREKLSSLLLELSNAGRHGSRFRREWLSTAVSIISPGEMEENDFINSDPDKDVRLHAEHVSHVEHQRREWERTMKYAANNDDFQGYEVASEGLRLYIQRYADRIASRKWGGSFDLDLPLLATIIRAGLEIYTYNGVGNADDIELAWDTRTIPIAGRPFPVSFRALYVPEELHMPRNGSFVAGALRSTMDVQEPQLPIIKLYLNNYHYMLCEGIHPNVSDFGLEWAATRRPPLSHPFATLNEEDQELLETSVENAMRSHTSDQKLGCSQKKPFSVINGCRIGSQEVCRLRAVPRAQQCVTDLWINDEIINSYSHLLWIRSEGMASESQRNGTKPPIQTYFCHTFFHDQLVSGAAHGEILRHNPFSRQLVLMPFQIDSNHWILAALRTTEHTIQIYDPQGRNRSEVALQVLKWVEKELGVRQGVWCVVESSVQMTTRATIYLFKRTRLTVVFLSARLWRPSVWNLL